MSYVQPASVISPRNTVRSVDVLYNTGEEGWSIARLNWNGERVLGMRWNGGQKSSLGTPHARGMPTWFVIPKELEASVLERVEEFVSAKPGGLAEGYAEMARDSEREREAEEWSEGLIGDASAPR